MPDTKAIVEGFQRLYRGRTDAWGAVTGMCNKEAVTQANYLSHLEAKVSLGIYPLLDDGTCWFAAVDLDQKDFPKALRIRNGFRELGLMAYISMSKSKGYHITMYAGDKPFNAKQIRRVMLSVLRNLNAESEIFPKQDMLDEQIPLGNYINIPYFGALTDIPSRVFITADERAVPLEQALKMIQTTPIEKVEQALKNLPPPETIVIPQEKLTTKKGRPSKHPPCIMKIMQGVSAGARDVAAFALARHDLDQGYTPEEVAALLVSWDAKNKPPIGNSKTLESKVRSAERGYAFGCASVKDEPLLKDLCVGENNCEWMKKNIKERKKKGLIREQSLYEDENFIYEEIYSTAEGAAFARFEKSTGDVTIVPEIQAGEVTIQPILSAEVTEGAVTLPTGVEEYGDTLNLVAELEACINRYCDIPKIYRELCCWYIVMSWVYDKLATLSYMRFIGDTGTGKSRSLDVVGKLCYKPMMMAGAVTPAPIYRLIRRWRGTLVMEEADLQKSDETSEVTKILNCGFERFRPVIRCMKDAPDSLEILPVYGPKVFATRFTFEDIALEARCLTVEMAETDRTDIPPILGRKFYDEAAKIRNKLLLYRFRHMTTTNPEDMEKIDLGNIEPRLKQIGLPFAVPFIAYPDVLERFKQFMNFYQKELLNKRSDADQGRIINTMFSLMMIHGNEYVSPGMIAKSIGDGKEISSQKVGKVLNSLRIKKTSRRNTEGQRANFIDWDPEIMAKQLRRYVVEKGDYDDLFNQKPDIEI